MSTTTTDAFFLALAASTPLPTPESAKQPVAPEPTALHRGRRPQTRSQTSTLPKALKLQLHLKLDFPPPVLPHSSKKRKPNFTIFVDADASTSTSPSTHIPATPLFTPKRSKTSTPRTPLSDRTYSSNSTPAPSPRLPDTPFTLSSADPYWEDIENYSVGSRTGMISPAATSTATSSSSSPLVSSSSSSSLALSWISTGAAASGEFASTFTSTTRSLRPRTNPSSSPSNLLPPVNMLVYNMLGLNSWRVSSDAIASAYRRRAATLHPDKAAPWERELANLTMQQLNAAKELLMDRRARGKYHRDGVVPWVV
ncbi:hypothetical protein ACJQWK_01833 [Exserohilum turcicum]|uniref:J domain-containing protein n=1 Tax=Exserohilum turcicum (strain 28A) TaxID=671987 RepID=R0IU29_EXST2|nr:uncharacterized protein SETTUDRAFT_38969 [Exserohilum turcica Et28A]EOA88310.1 hypothetical protein SETTUDRAFT_38969 [Exserohilum turcica Et28A]